MKSQINFKVENKLSSKIIISIICVLWMTIFSWAFFTTDVINYKRTILYVLSMIIALWSLLKVLFFKALVNGNDIKYQNIIIPFIYKNISFKEINKIKLVTRTTNPDADNNLGGGEPYDVMCFYGNKSKLFSISMNSKNGKRLYEVAISNGVRIEDKRKK